MAVKKPRPNPRFEWSAGDVKVKPPKPGAR